MKACLKNIATKLFIAFMAVQVINLSINAVEFEPLDASNDIGDFNYMNSMTEYVAEILLHHKDAFPEYQKESPSSSIQFLKYFSYKVYPPESWAIEKNFTFNETVFEIPVNENSTFSCIVEINPPPPKQNIIYS